MKRIWMTQQAPFGHMPLRVGLNLATPEEMREYAIFNGTHVKEAILKTHQRSCKSLTDIEYSPDLLCPKLYTTRTHPLSGEYFVVEGSRFKATPVEPRIEFRVVKVWELNLRTGMIKNKDDMNSWEYSTLNENAPLKPKYTFPELDLGFCGASFTMLQNELLRLNKKTTIDTIFYVNRLVPIEDEVGD